MSKTTLIPDKPGELAARHFNKTKNKKNMSFQKCPVCEGSGKVQRFGVNPVCHVCNGHGIIDEVTGKPPVSSDTSSATDDVYIPKSPSVAPPNDLHTTITSKSSGRKYDTVPGDVIAAANKEMKEMLRRIKSRK